MPMTHERLPTPQEKDGARWLRMLGRPELIGTNFTLKDGSHMMAEDFPDACPEDGVNMLYALEQLGPDHPLYIANFPTAQHLIEVYFGAPSTEQK